LESCEKDNIQIPQAISAAFSRLNYGLWNPSLKIEYKEDIKDRENFKTTLLIEYEEGRVKERLEIARKMLANKLDDETIIKCSGLTIEELHKLKKEERF